MKKGISERPGEAVAFHDGTRCFTVFHFGFQLSRARGPGMAMMERALRARGARIVPSLSSWDAGSTLVAEYEPMAAQPRRALAMTLAELVDRYRALAGDFGKAAPLAGFELTSAETEALFSGYDEDYHISRFFHFSEAGGTQFSINGEPATHVSIDAEIASIL